MLYEGGQTTEASTTSTSAVDLLTTGTLSIATGLPVLILCAFRTDNGGSHRAEAGMKVNSTVIGEAAIGGNPPFCQFDADASARNKYAMVVLGPRITNYERGTYGIQSGGTDGAISEGNAPAVTADMPTATITSIAIRGIVEDAALTFSADELHVYSYPIS